MQKEKVNGAFHNLKLALIVGVGILLIDFCSSAFLIAVGVPDNGSFLLRNLDLLAITLIPLIVIPVLFGYFEGRPLYAATEANSSANWLIYSGYCVLAFIFITLVKAGVASVSLTPSTVIPAYLAWLPILPPLLAILGLAFYLHKKGHVA